MSDLTRLSDSLVWRPRAIIFDLLTAVLDSWSLWNSSTPSGTAEEGIPWRQRYLELTYGAGAYVPYETLVQAAARDVGLPKSAPVTLLERWDTLQAWPDTGQVLRRLKDCGYKLGVITNCSKELGHRAALRANGAGGSDLFDAVITAEEIGYYKPAGEAYSAVLTAMKVKPDEALFVAGSAADVEGATNAGLRVVWHNRIGLAKLGNAVPLKQDKTLEETLKGFLQ